MRQRVSSRALYPISKEVSLSTELAALVAELAEVEAVSEAHIVRLALERLGLAYRRRGRDALRLQSFRRRFTRKQAAAAEAEATPSAADSKATSAG